MTKSAIGLGQLILDYLSIEHTYEDQMQRNCLEISLIKTYDETRAELISRAKRLVEKEERGKLARISSAERRGIKQEI